MSKLLSISKISSVRFAKTFSELNVVELKKLEIGIYNPKAIEIPIVNPEPRIEEIKTPTPIKTKPATN
jgi:hypothetical protein